MRLAAGRLNEARSCMARLLIEPPMQRAGGLVIAASLAAFVSAASAAPRRQARRCRSTGARAALRAAGHARAFGIS